MEIGWIGTGVMGASMAAHLQAAGHQLHIFNRTRSKADALVAKGGIWCESPAAVAAAGEIVFTIVGYPDDVESTYLGDDGVLSAQAKCRTVVDMTTSRPSLAVHIAKVAAGFGIVSLDAPVSGGDIGARDGTLAIMVGGDRERFNVVSPLFELMGTTIAHMGTAGTGQHTKMCNQTLAAGTMIGVCESLLYAQRVGLDSRSVIDIIGSGAAGSWAINHLGPRIVAGDYEPGFFVEHFVKDMELALAEAAAVNLSLPGLALVNQLYIAVKAQGGARLGSQALMAALKQLNGDTVVP